MKKDTENSIVQAVLCLKSKLYFFRPWGIKGRRGNMANHLQAAWAGFHPTAQN